MRVDTSEITIGERVRRDIDIDKPSDQLLIAVETVHAKLLIGETPLRSDLSLMIHLACRAIEGQCDPIPLDDREAA